MLLKHNHHLKRPGMKLCSKLKPAEATKTGYNQLLEVKVISYDDFVSNQPGSDCQLPMQVESIYCTWYDAKVKQLFLTC
jgi:hypothetical protein